MIDSLIEKLKLLRLKAFAENLSQVFETAKQKNWSVLQSLDHLADLELELRKQNRKILCFKQSKLFEKPTLDQFDFNFHLSRKKQKTLIQNLMSLDFVNKKKDIILIGNPGVGKTLLAKCIAYAATQATIKILFTTAIDMINHFSARHERKSTMITTNLPFANWGNIFDSTTVATAIADRLVYNSEVLIMEGNSYRKRSKKS